MTFPQNLLSDCPLFINALKLKDNILCTRSTMGDLTELLQLKLEMEKDGNTQYHEKLNCAVKHLVEQVDIFQQICIRELKSHTEKL